MISALSAEFVDERLYGVSRSSRCRSSTTRTLTYPEPAAEPPPRQCPTEACLANALLTNGGQRAVTDRDEPIRRVRQTPAQTDFPVPAGIGRHGGWGGAGSRPSQRKPPLLRRTARWRR